MWPSPSGTCATAGVTVAVAMVAGESVLAGMGLSSSSQADVLASPSEGVHASSGVAPSGSVGIAGVAVGTTGGFGGGGVAGTGAAAAAVGAVPLVGEKATNGGASWVDAGAGPAEDGERCCCGCWDTGNGGGGDPRAGGWGAGGDGGDDGDNVLEGGCL